MVVLAMTRILVVDDEKHMRQLLKLYLSHYSFEVDEAVNGEEGYNKILDSEYDLIILDIMMPKMNGWQVLEKVRKISKVPVILLTAKGELEEKVEGLMAGADDYLVKPFEEAELIARIQAVLRRTNNLFDEEVLKYKGLILNQVARDVSYKGEGISLTQTEFDLLNLFIRYKGKAFTREQLVEQVWGIEFMGDDRTIDAHIKNLRAKLRKAGIQEDMIQTVWGVGYKAP